MSNPRTFAEEQVTAVILAERAAVNSIVAKVLAAFDQADKAKYDENKWADFCEADGVEPLRAILARTATAAELLEGMP